MIIVNEGKFVNDIDIKTGLPRLYKGGDELPFKVQAWLDLGLCREVETKPVKDKIKDGGK